MILTKSQFRQYAIDVKGYDELQVNEIFQDMKENGTPIQSFLSQEELEECAAFNA